VERWRKSTRSQGEDRRCCVRTRAPGRWSLRDMRFHRKCRQRRRALRERRSGSLLG
jgi:hypothetical protein